MPKITRIEAGANDGVAAFLELKEVTREFLFFYLETQTRYLREVVAPGLGQPNLNTELIGQLAIPIPPKPVRDAIDQLGLLHVGLAEDLSKLLVAKRAQRRGLAQQLLTGHRRFANFVRSLNRQTGEFSTLPADWDRVQIGDIAHETQARGAVNGTIVYSCTKHAGLVPSLEYFGKQVYSRSLAGYRRLEGGDFAYATNHIEEGSIGRLPEGHPAGLVSPMYTVFRPTGRVSRDFLFALLKTESYRRVFAKRTSASVNRRGSLRWKDFARITIGLPSREEQDQIANTLRLVDIEIAQLAQLGKLAEAQKRALLGGLLSGEISIPA